MIKILFMIHDLGPGGAEKVLVNLVNNLDKTKFDVTVISLFGGGVNENNLDKGVHYYSIFKRMIRGNSKIMKFFSPKILHKFCIKDNYDIEVSYLEGSSARIISGCKNPNTKLISWIHVEQHTKKVAAQSFRTYKESLDCYNKFDRIISVSESVKEDFESLYDLKVISDVLYNTNETDNILTLKDEKVEDGIFNENEIKLCGVGKIMPIKGFDKLARIHKKLIEEGFPIHTYILGEGEDKKKIEKYILDNKLERTFTFLGYQKNPYKYVSKCDLFICASTSEGFSTAATEALIVGTPVITTPVAGMVEMLGKKNEYGIISEMSEESLYHCIKKVISDSNLLNHYKTKALERGKDFSKQKTVDAVETYFTNLYKEDIKI